jgi:hypothetical protein
VFVDTDREVRAHLVQGPAGCDSKMAELSPISMMLDARVPVSRAQAWSPHEGVPAAQT